MFKLLKSIAAVALLLLSSLVLSGCAKSAGPANNDNQPSAQAVEPAAQPEAPTTQSQRDANVATIVAFITDNKNRAKFVSYKPDERGGVEVVFTGGGKQYTLYFSGKAAAKEALSYWVRPVNTTERRVVATFTDEGLDGKVDSGLIGRGGPDLAKPASKFFQDSPNEKHGEGFRPFWQQQYDKAIAATLRYIGQKSLLTAKDI